MTRWLGGSLLLSSALLLAGCGSGTPELGPQKDTKKEDPAVIQKAMDEGMQKAAEAMKAANKTGVAPPTGGKAPGSE